MRVRPPCAGRWSVFLTPVCQLTSVDVHLGRAGRPVHALTDVSLAIHPGERVALVGANGCGKSTLLRVLHGLIAPTAGCATRDTQARQAMVFQRPYLMRLSVQSHIALGLWLRGTPWRDAKRQALSALDQLGLRDLAMRSARQLSGGQQQRVALAQAWALSPQVLFLDEPTAGLDPIGAAAFDELILTLREALGLTVFIITHDLDTLYAICDRVAVLADKKVVANAPLAEIERFDHPWVQEYFHGPRARAAQVAANGERRMIKD